MKKINIAIIGCGDFSSNFVPLFQKHPAVKKVRVCDLIKERAADVSDYVNPAEMTKNKNTGTFKQDVANHIYYRRGA